MSEPGDRRGEEEPAEDEEFDEFYEDVGEAQHLPADHPLMTRLQGALHKQLSDDNHRVELQLREKEETLKSLRREREDVGVQLYGFQQQLAKMQMTFERTHDNFNIIQKYRKEAEEQLKLLSEEYEKKKQEVEDQARKVNKAQDELNQLNRTLNQVEEYNRQMTSEIAVTKTTTYTAEENVVRLEKDKKKQDLLIDTMNEEMKRLTEQANLIQAQIISQSDETQAARKTLEEANSEMEKIIESKKELMNQWQELLRMMKKRDEALQSVHDKMRELQDREASVDSELAGYMLSIKKETEFGEDLEKNHSKILSEIDFIKKKKKEIKADIKILNEQYNMLKEAQKTTEVEIARFKNEIKSIKDQIDVIDKNIMRIHQEITRKKMDIMNVLSEKTTTEKSADNRDKLAAKILFAVGEKETDLESVRNEIARVNIDVLNTKQWIEVLQKKDSDIDREVKEKEGIKKKYERNIRENYDELKKKQLARDKLNKELEKYRHSVVDESAGPYLAKLNNIKQEIERKRQEMTRLEREWIDQQTRLVDFQKKITESSEESQQLRSRNTIMEQRKMRLEGEVTIINKDIFVIQNGLKGLRTDMNKLNLLLDKNNEAFVRVESENFNIEHDFTERLKELERETVQIEGEIGGVRTEKEDVLEEIVEAERQILLWERKIQLEKEMQQTIDPNIGQKEMESMKKEIHRMERKHDDLRKKQEFLIKEMERAISKRETIQLKYQPKADQMPKGGASVTKQISNLKNTLRHTTQNSQQLEQSSQERLREMDEIAARIEGSTQRVQEQEEQINQATVEVLGTKMLKQANTWLITKNQLLAKRYEEVREGKLRLSMREEQLGPQLAEEVKKTQAINEVLTHVREEQPQFAVFLEKLMNWQ